MTAKSKVVALEHVVIRFSGDSGDGMQLTGNPIRLKSAHRKAPWLASLASKCTLDTNPFTPPATFATSSWP